MAVRERPGTDNFALPFWLSRLHEKIERTVEVLKKSPDAARIFEQREAEAVRLAARWRGKGTRGLVVGAARNRLVGRLLDEMESLRDGWMVAVRAADGVSVAERESFKATLHERVREILDLPPLSRESAILYHRVGVRMLRDAAGVRGDFTIHPAFRKGGEFADFDRARYSKNYLGALSEAWKKVAEKLPSVTKPAKSQNRSPKG